SLMLLAVVPQPASPVLDIGSGPGIPGLILKLARPEWDVTLVEAARRRANFLRHVVRPLSLPDVTVHGARAEPLASGDLANRFRTVTMRAVRAVRAAAALARPFLAPTGVLILPLGPPEQPPRDFSRQIVLTTPGELPWRRQFLIIPRAELEAGVPRGTERA